METPEIGGYNPIRMEMEPGTYYWCSCGKSSNQPFCDGSHKGSSFSPMAVNITETKTVSWCTCKQTSNQSFCNGAHKQLTPPQE